MADTSSIDELLAAQRKEKKELIAKTQKMKHGVPKGDKKKKKEVTAEITQLLADLDLKHENEVKDYENAALSLKFPEKSESSDDIHGLEKNKDVECETLEHKKSASFDDTKILIGEDGDNFKVNQRMNKAQKRKENAASTSKLSENSESSDNIHGQEKCTDVECATLEHKESASFDDAKILFGKAGDNFQVTQRMSKAQKRRNKKAALAKERDKAIAEQEVENLVGLRHRESECIQKKLLERNLMIYDIPSDGNCLYKAVEHQLSSKNLKPMTVQALREETSRYMLSHMEDFIPFLACPETGDVFNEEKYVKYCEDIAKTSAWGGHIEVQALSRVCGLPIEIIQAEGPSVITGLECGETRLILSYHRHVYGLGEHYNSVVPVNL